MTYQIIKTFYPSGSIFLSIFRKDYAEMKYPEIQDVKTKAIGDLDCIMYYPKQALNIDNANVYHLLHLKGFEFPIKLQDLEVIEYEKFSVSEI